MDNKSQQQQPATHSCSIKLTPSENLQMHCHDLQKLRLKMYQGALLALKGLLLGKFSIVYLPIGSEQVPLWTLACMNLEPCEFSCVHLVV